MLVEYVIDLIQVTMSQLFPGESVEIGVNNSQQAGYRLVGQLHEFQVGRKCIQNVYEHGFQMLRTAERRYKYHQTSGMPGLDLLVCHEVAHALQVRDGARLPGSLHNCIFYTHFLDLVTAFGCQDCFGDLL